MVGRRATRWGWLAFLALALALTGDRLRLASPDPGVLLIAHTLTAASERAVLDDLIREFEAGRPGTRVEQLILNSEVYQTVGWRLLMRGRRPPDIYFLWRGYKTSDAIDRGLALDMAPHLDPTVLEDLVPTAVLRRGNAIYHLPQSIDISNLVWVNRDLLGRAGLEKPADLETWLEACRQLRAAGILPLIQGNRDLWPIGNLAAEFLGQELGTDTLDRLFVPGEPVGPEVMAGLAPLARLAEEGAFDLPGLMNRGAIAGFGDIDAKVFFLTGRAAQHIVGSWLLADVEDAAEKGALRFEVGLFPVPPAPHQSDAITAVTTGWMVHAETPDPQAAVDLVSLLVSRRYQERFARLGGLSGRRDAEEFTGAPLARKALEILRNTPVWVSPPDTAYAPDQARVFYDLAGRLAAGRLTPADAVDLWNREKRDLARKGL